MANKNIKINLDYAQFSGGIQECQRKMGLLTEEFKMQQSALGNNASEVDKLTLSQNMLQQKINLQIQAVEKAAERFNAMAESEGATAKQVDNAQMAYMKQITALNNLTNQLNDVNSKLEETANAEEEAGESANNTSDSIGGMSGTIASAVVGVTAFIQVIEQTAQSMASLATQSTQWADNLSTLSSQTGLSTQTLQELAYASNFVDVSVETMQGSMTKLTQKMAEAQSGSTSAQQAFSNLGVSVTNTDGSLKSTEQVFYEVIDALGQVDNAAQRDADAMSIFGRSAQELNPLIDQGSEALKKYGQEAEELGMIMSGDQIESLNQAQNSFDKLGAVMEASSNRVSGAVAPAFGTLADVLSSVPTPVIDTVTAMGKFGQMAGQVGSTVSQYIQTLSSLKTAKAVTTMATNAETVAEGGLAMAASAANAALAPQILAVGALIAAFAALVGAIKSLVDAYHDYKEAAEAAGVETGSFLDTVKGAFTGDLVPQGAKHYALGGRVQGGQVWVGEQGPELVDLPMGSYVHNASESQQAATGNVTNITVNVDHISELSDLLRISQQAQQRSRMGVNS